MNRISKSETLDTCIVYDVLAIPNLVVSQFPEQSARRPGQLVLDRTTGSPYYSDGTIWQSMSGAQGPQGSQGNQGPQGAQGNPGPLLLIDDQTFILHAADNTTRLGFNMQGASNTTTTFQTSQSIDRTIISPDIGGTLIVSQTGAPITNIGSGMVFINSLGPLHQSSSGIQYSTDGPLSGAAPGATVSSQIRTNQYGANANVPGISTFKSRGLTIGSLASVAVNDVIFGVTAVGVTGNNLIPIGGLIQLVATSVPPASGWIGTEYVLSLVSKNGPANGRRKVFRVDSEGILHLYEGGIVQGSPQPGVAGLVTLDLAGILTVANVNVSATSRITLTIQDGGAIPTGAVYVSTRIVGTSFSIGSTSGVGNAGVNVYYQIYEPSPPV